MYPIFSFDPTFINDFFRNIFNYNNFYNINYLYLSSFFKKINMKKILMLSWSDLYGGAARACYQTYLSIKKDNKNIELFVQKKISKDKNIQTYKRSTVNLLFRKYFSLIMYKLRFSIHDYSYNLINSDIITVSCLISKQVNLFTK